MLIHIIILSESFVFLTGSALLALSWALRTGQLRGSRKTALLVFDEDEPDGRMTDRFPSHDTRHVGRDLLRLRIGARADVAAGQAKVIPTVRQPIRSSIPTKFR